MLPLRQSYLWSLLPPRSLFLLLKSPKGLARLVTKAGGEVAKGRGERWPKVKGLARVVLGQRIRTKVRRPRAQRLLSSPRMLLPSPRMLLPKQRKLIPIPRKLILRPLTLLSPN